MDRIPWRNKTNKKRFLISECWKEIENERMRVDKLAKAISFLCMHSEGKNMDGTDRRNTDIEECGRNWDKAIKNAKEALEGAKGEGK